MGKTLRGLILILYFFINSGVTEATPPPPSSPRESSQTDTLAATTCERSPLFSSREMVVPRVCEGRRAQYEKGFQSARNGDGFITEISCPSIGSLSQLDIIERSFPGNTLLSSDPICHDEVPLTVNLSGATDSAVYTKNQCCNLGYLEALRDVRHLISNESQTGENCNLERCRIWSVKGKSIAAQSCTAGMENPSAGQTWSCRDFEQNITNLIPVHVSATANETGGQVYAACFESGYLEEMGQCYLVMHKRYGDRAPAWQSFVTLESYLRFGPKATDLYGSSGTAVNDATGVRPQDIGNVKNASTDTATSAN